MDEVVGAVIDPRRADRLPAPEAELLASWDVEALVEALRDALPGDEVAADPGAVSRFACRLSTAVMGGFLLLGAAAVSGCADDDSDNVSADAAIDRAVADAPVPDRPAWLPPDLGPWYSGCSLGRSTVLYSTLDQAKNISNGAKRSLCRCLASLSTNWSNGLTQLFSSGKPDEIAAVLEEMLSCCNSHNKDKLNLDFDSAKAALVKKKLCDSGVPIYKGVSFPE